MRDALRANDQEQYFRVLARGDVLLPISGDPVSVTGESGWGTWTTEGRTHVLAFTSPRALSECLAGHAGSYRRIPFRDLAGLWPNVDWWLAVNPGLPIEGYLPSWFVTQISRGDVRLPGRTLGARARIDQASNLRTRAVAQVPVRDTPNQSPPTTIERQRMKSGGNPSADVPVRVVPPPDVAPPGTFLPARADRPPSRFFPEATAPEPAPPPVAPPSVPAAPPAPPAPPARSLPSRGPGSNVHSSQQPPQPWRSRTCRSRWDRSRRSRRAPSWGRARQRIRPVSASVVAGRAGAGTRRLSGDRPRTGSE